MVISKNGIYHLCMVIVALVLILFFLNQNLPPQPDRYVSAHAALTVLPIWGFSADSVFNTGDAKALDKFQGIGEVIAQRIIEGRAALGGYRIPEDLLLVKGVGEKTLEKILVALDESLVELLPLEE